MLNFETFPVGPLSCNCVLVWDPEKKTGVVVDPGDEAGRIQKQVERHGFKVVALMQTHAHFDHLGATKSLQDLWQCPAYLHPADRFLVEILDTQTGLYGMDPVQAPVLTDLHPGDVHHGLKVLYTPGHSPGSCSFVGTFERGQVVISGDTLFRGSVGRTDILGGQLEQLKTSIVRQLYPLDDDTLVIPGHGGQTTIGQEAGSNPFVRR